MTEPKLWTKNFVLACSASFMMFFAFYMLMPVIATYVIDEFKVSPYISGMVVSCYIITALLVRPVSGYMVDKYNRKRLYILSYLFFATLYLGYVFASSLILFVVVRILLGGTFSIVTTAGSTLTIDIIPSQRRGEGIGMAGAISNVAMAAGPMTAMYMKDLLGYKSVFVMAVIFCFAGVVIASLIKIPPRKPVVHEPISLDRFFLTKGMFIAVVVALIGLPYGSIMTFIPLYAKEAAIDINIGTFFVFFAIGIIVSRVATGKMLNKGKMELTLNLGMAAVLIGLSIITIIPSLLVFYLSPFILGLGFGMTQPTLQTMIINIAPHNKRGTANSTFFISLDFGSGIGMFIGGFIATQMGYKYIYVLGLLLIIISITIFNSYISKKYNKMIRNVK